MVLSSHIRAFRDLKAELGPEKFAEAHLPSVPRCSRAGSGGRAALFRHADDPLPLLILAGEATLLAQRTRRLRSRRRRPYCFRARSSRTRASRGFSRSPSPPSPARRCSSWCCRALPSPRSCRCHYCACSRTESRSSPSCLYSRSARPPACARSHTRLRRSCTPDKPICAEDEACEDMLVLTKGTASVKIRLGAAVMRPKPTPAAAAAWPSRARERPPKRRPSLQRSRRRRS